jgi:hypothetical protein
MRGGAPDGEMWLRLRSATEPFLYAFPSYATESGNDCDDDFDGSGLGLVTQPHGADCGLQVDLIGYIRLLSECYHSEGVDCPRGGVGRSPDFGFTSHRDERP